MPNSPLSPNQEANSPFVPNKMSDEENPCEQDIFERELILDDLKRTIQFAATDEQQFRSRTTDLVAHQRKFNKVQSKIEKTLFKLKRFNKEEQIKIRNDFNDLYYAVVTHLTSLKKEEEEHRRMSRPSLPFAATQLDMVKKLPNLPLPTFNGDPTDWPSYYDLFKSLVHYNNAYTDAEKFRYLLLTIKNEPHNLVKSIPITDDNYSIALECLVSRYDNKRVIASKHLDKILDIDTCTDKSPHSVRNLLNVYQENIKALEVMHFPVKQWSFMLLNILLRKIPISTRRFFERSLTKTSDIPDVDTLISFLEREISAEEIIVSVRGQSAKSTNSDVGSSYGNFSNRASSAGAAPKQPARRSFVANVSPTTSPSADSRPSDQGSSKTKPNCVCCEAQHQLTKCSKFLNLSPRDRYSLVQNKNICYNCLNIGHDVRSCKSNFVCRTCHKRHHTLIHYYSHSMPVVSESSEPSVVALPPTEEGERSVSFSPTEKCSANTVAFPLPIGTALHGNCAARAPCTRSDTVLLSTALVDVCLGDTKLSTVRCLVDTGSQATFITEACAQRLRLPRKQVTIPVFGIGDTEPVQPKGVVSCFITPKGKQHPAILVDALVLPKLISRMPCVPLPQAEWTHLNNLTLADPDFRTPQPVEMLLGADILSQILLKNVITGSPGSPIAMDSIFGYLLLGKVSFDTAVPTPLQVQVCFSSFDNDNLQRFWELESLHEKRSYTPDEQICESFFQKTHTRDETGRYVVALPFKPDAPPLGESRQIALARFRKLEYRLERDPKLKADYHACLQEYVDLNHMEPVESDTLSPNYYIPHHCVVKESSETTRTRVVFDAGCKSTSGHSLNDTLLTGPKLHQDIVDVLLKFRIYSIAFTADIKQMYRNILIRESDRNYQRIVWRRSPEEPIQDYELRTVTFGVSSSPFLALRTIQQLARDEASRFKLASPVLLNSVFVDDVVSGEDTESKALALQQELIDICGTAGFELRKWHSNSPAILAAVLPPGSHGERPENVPFAEMENDQKVKVLGLQWNPNSDTFDFKVQVTTDKCTKRVILSEIAKIYDPLGFLSPVTLYAKYLIQLLWIANVDWDEAPPVDIVNAWASFINELPLLSQVSFPRHIFTRLNSIQIHAFGDASERSIAGCVYLRLKDSDGHVSTFLVMAKTRVAPLRVRLTIPRLELMASVLVSRLVQKVTQTYDGRIDRDQIYAWSDSAIVLAWLRAPPHEWKTFVSNRTSEILSCVPAACWRHVPSAENPSDAASRGMLPSAFLQHDMWFHGPAWLKKSPSAWPSSKQIPTTNEEKRTIIPLTSNATATGPIQDVEIISRYSTLGKLVRVTSLIFRFYKLTKQVIVSFPKCITVPEYNFALERLIQLVQHSVFAEDIKNISRGNLPSNSLRRLTPFVDKDNFLRVGGRIHKSLLPFESKHQLILPKKHPLTDLIIDDAHVSQLHAGPQSVQYFLRQRFWIVSGRDIVRQRVHRCVACFRARPARTQPRMGPLPAPRLRPARPFVKTAVDYAGPFYVRANNVRNAKIVKCYVAVFVCMSVKAIHLEIVSDLTTEAFLAALRRFTSRRGLCTDIFSDCGRNFVGCNNYLKDLYTFLRNDSVQSELNRQTLQQGITWHFQPAYASHFSGLVEAGVKSFKHHLYRVVGTRTQTYDEMHTLLCQVEAVLNSRPLCVMSSDSTDPLPLMPAHFLVGEPLTVLPDISLTDENPTRLTRWRWVQQCTQHFWKRWSREYIHELQQSHKWLQPRGTAAREGAVVVVCDDQLPPLQWRLARIHALHPGSDGVTRVVTLKTGNTFYKRPVVKICPLPIE